MQNPMLNLVKAYLFLRNQVICLKSWKLWRAPTYVEFNIFCSNFVHVSVLPMSTKGWVGFLKFCLDFLVIDKPGFYECVETSFFLILANNSSSKQNKKSPTHPFVVTSK